MKFDKSCGMHAVEYSPKLSDSVKFDKSRGMSCVRVSWAPSPNCDESHCAKNKWCRCNGISSCIKCRWLVLLVVCGW